MLKKLHFSVTFPTTGRTIKDDHDFSKGLTAIVGPNERGKSVRLEMVRYALWGTKALRAPATEYKKLHVELDFSVNGDDYKVVRNSNAKLFKGDEQIAAGTKPVNQKIIEIFGYDMLVFDMANNCMQGKVTELGEMTPAQRKAMVDQTIGLNAVDEVISQVGEKANAAKRAAEALEPEVVEPTEPEKPEGYLSSDVLTKEVDHVRSLVNEANEIRGWLSRKAPSDPTEPKCDIFATVEDLEAHEQARKDHDKAIDRVEAKMDALDPINITVKEVDDLERKLHAYREYQGLPKHSVEQLKEWDTTWDVIEAWNERVEVLRQIEQLEGNGVDCPKCGHNFEIEHERLGRLHEELASYDHVKDIVDSPKRPPFAPHQINEMLEAWGGKQNVNIAPDPGVDERGIQELRRRLQDNEEYDRLEAERKAMKRLPDRSKDLEKRRRYEWEKDQYERALIEYRDYVNERDDKTFRLKDLEGYDAKLQDLLDRRDEALAYEQRLQHYTEAMDTYLERVKTLTALKDEAEQFALARKGLKELKVKVKQYLVPSLNRVASHLIDQMTNGDRTSIVVDEDFNITVDGQPLQTLSGSGLAVANLAIRISLGQVLTSRVFSVFMGDEIDAYMDASRAEYTTQCLRNLTQTMSQVILVTHKRPEVDNQIDLT